VTVQESGSEAVTAAFQRMGAASDQMSLRMQQNNRAAIMSFAALSTQSLGLVNLFDRLAKGQLDAGQAALSLSYYTLNLASQLMMLNMLYGKRLGLQGASVAASGAEAVSTGAATGASVAHGAALRVESAALAAKNALSGPWGWAIIAGAGAAMLAGMAVVSQVPKMAQGGIVTSPTLVMAGDDGPEAFIPLNKGLGFGSSITVHVYGASNYEEARRGAFDGTVEALGQMNGIQRKGAS